MLDLVQAARRTRLLGSWLVALSLAQQQLPTHAHLVSSLDPLDRSFRNVSSLVLADLKEFVADMYRCFHCRSLYKDTLAKYFENKYVKEVSTGSRRSCRAPVAVPLAIVYADVFQHAHAASMDGNVLLV